MENKKYYWLKLKEDFFEEKQIKYLRSLPDGDKLVIAYLKMQLKSLKTEGFIKYDSVLPSNIEELAMILDEDTNIIQLMIKALEQTKAVEVLDDGSFYMIAMQDLIGKEGKSAERVRQFRKRKKQEVLQCNSGVTKCNTEIEIEKEIEKDIEIYKKENKKEKRYFENDKLNEIFIEFLQIRKKIGAVNSDRAIKTLLNELSKYDDETKYKMIEKSIVNSWKDVYELKEEKYNKSENLTHSQKQNKLLEALANGQITVN